MFVRKIVDWISYNQQLNPSEELNGVNKYYSTSSLGGETSVLDYCFMAENSSCDIASCKSEERKVMNCESQKYLPPIAEEVCKQVQAESDTERTEEIRKNGVKTSDCDSECISDLEFKIRTLSSKNTNSNNKRSIFTQTDRKLDKRRHSAMVRDGCSPIVPSLQVLDKSNGLTSNRSVANYASFTSNENIEHASDPVVYGTFFVFGCNGTVPAHLVGTMASKFLLRKRTRANGLKEAFSYTLSDDEPDSVSPAKHSIYYSLSDDRSVVVAYKHDGMTDMFQIGRYEKPPIDFRVGDIRGSDEARNGVSRFACRIVVRRDQKHEAQVYAAAFDSSESIFLGESGITYNQRGKMDGFTTNGVLIMHPQDGIWREVSVCGFIYPLRSQTLQAIKRPRLLEAKNVLQDGTLIDLCGVTLLWRTPDGLKNTPNSEYLNRLQGTIHREVPECQLFIPGIPMDRSKKACKKAYVYLSCGHVVGLTLSEPPLNPKGWSCAICRVIGPIAELSIGAEPGFYRDWEFPGYVFKPCGHAASKKTIEYWSRTKMPSHRNIQDSFCPFCRVKLNNVSKFVKLTLPAHNTQ